MKKNTFVLIIALFIVSICVANAAESGKTFTGNLWLDTPFSVDKPSFNSPRVGADLTFPNLLGNWSLKVTGQYNYKTVGDPENKLTFGLERPLSQRFIFFAGYERRYTTGFHRGYVGIRMPFGGTF